MLAAGQVGLEKEPKRRAPTEMTRSRSGCESDVFLGEVCE